MDIDIEERRYCTSLYGSRDFEDSRTNFIFNKPKRLVHLRSNKIIMITVILFFQFI